MEGLNDCQIAEREQKYPFAKNMGYLRQLCNGCLDSVCDHSIYYEKCSVDHNAERAGAQSVYGRYPDNNDGMNEYNGQHKISNKYPVNDDFMDRYYGADNVNNEGMNTIEISSNMLWVISALMIINVVCLTIYCMDNKCNISNKKQGYGVVKYDSEDAQLV